MWLNWNIVLVDPHAICMGAAWLHECMSLQALSAHQLRTISNPIQRCFGPGSDDMGAYVAQWRERLASGRETLARDGPGHPAERFQDLGCSGIETAGGYKGGIG